MDGTKRIHTKTNTEILTVSKKIEILIIVRLKYYYSCRYKIDSNKKLKLLLLGIYFDFILIQQMNN